MDWRQRILGQRRIAAHRSIEGLSNVDRWQRILCGRCPTTDRGIEFLEDALKRLLRRSAQVAVAAVMVVSPAFAALTCLQPVAAILRGSARTVPCGLDPERPGEGRNLSRPSGQFGSAVEGAGAHARRSTQ